MAHCGLCEDPEISPDIKVYQACELSDGVPCSPCQQHIELEAEIQAAKETLHKLLARRQSIRTQINHQHDPVVHRLPPELTAKIFQAYVQFDDEDKDWEVHSTPSPLLFGAVCGAWRRIAWATPQLWSHISISIPGPEQWRRRLIDVPQAWLDRSQDQPLSMYIYIDCQESWPVKDPQRVYYPFIQMINQYSHRWEDFRINCSPTILHMFCGNGLGAPHLRKLCLSVFDLELRPEDEYAITAVQSDSEVKARPSHVQISNIYFKWLDIDWSNLVDALFYQNTMLVDDCIILLRQAPQLRCLNVIDITDPDEPDWQDSVTFQQPFVHLGLERLRLQRYEGHSLGLFLNSFAFPALTYLGLHDIPDPLLSRHIIDLLTRSPMPNLAYFDIARSVYYDYETLLEVLKAVPFLVELSIPNTLTTDEVFNLLRLLGSTALFDKFDDPRTHFLPNLQILSYSEFMDSVLDDSSFWDIVFHLCGPREVHPSSIRRPLKCITISGYSFEETPQICSNKESVERIAELSRAGVVFKIKDHEGTDLIGESMRFHGLTFDI